MNRIRTLDGWRGIAILLVIAEHAGWERFEHQTWAGLGSLGVDIFFVLSGYIITARLIEERDKSGTISLPLFYLRRGFRILPLVLCYLTVLCVLSIFVHMSIEPSQIAGSLFFFRNYQYAAQSEGVYTAHFWSLSIEEHFYLLWPLLLLKFGNRRGVWIAGIGAMLCGMWRFFDYTHPHSLLGRYLPGSTVGLRTLRTDARLDGLLLGCALALLLVQPAVVRFIQKNCPKEMPLLCATLLVLNEQRVNSCATFSSYILISMMVASSLVIQEGLAHKWLNSRILVGIGTISYSLYVWQQIFLLHPKGTHPLGLVAVFPLNILAALTVAACSYYLLEKPTVAYGRRLISRRSAVTSNHRPIPEMISS
jgi:peptidoglycan/LPS O-acetylase OafA/YrhL